MLLAAASSANGGRESMTISGRRGKSGGTNNGKTAVFQAADFLRNDGLCRPITKKVNFTPSH